MAIKEILYHNCDAKIIMITAIGHENDMREGLNMGVKEVIVKPFTHSRLVKAFNKTIGKCNP